MLTTYQRQAKMKLAATIVALIVIAGVVVFTDTIKPKSNSVAATILTTTDTQAPQSIADSSAGQSSAVSSGSASGSTPAATTSSSNASGYKNGTFSATADYHVPDGSETIEVSLTIKSGIVMNASVQNSEYDPTSAQYQESFVSVYKSSVVGQKIRNLQLSVIGGASDTTQGFNDALSQITSKAQA